jgi:predicted patatin/cPLA2 family phospholipase
MKKEKIILYVGGGAMAGVFSGGVLAGLQKINFYDRIEAIYAGSAGAMNAAYFLSGQTELGASIYFEDLTHDFILPGNIPIGIAKLLWSKYVAELPRDKTRYTVNIDYAMDLISRRKRLTQEKIRERKIDFYVKLFDINIGEIEYVDAKQNDIFSVLRAACCCAPHYPF